MIPCHPDTTIMIRNLIIDCSHIYGTLLLVMALTAAYFYEDQDKRRNSSGTRREIDKLLVEITYRKAIKK